MTIGELGTILVGLGALNGVVLYFLNKGTSERLSEISILKSGKEIEKLEQEIDSKYSHQIRGWLADLQEIKEKHDLELEKKEKLIVEMGERQTMFMTEMALLQLKLKQCGRAHRRLFVELGIPYWECARDGKLIYANGYWLKLFGLTSEEAMGEGWLKSIPEEDQKKLLIEWYSKVVDESDGSIEFTVLNPTTGKTSMVRAIYAVKFDDHGDVYKIIGVTMEIPEN